jgi:hypothetical protein
VRALLCLLLALVVGCGSSSPSTPPAPSTPAAGRPLLLFVGGQSNAIAQEGTGDVPGFPRAIPLIARSLGPEGFAFDTGAEPVDLGPIGGFHSLELAAAADLQAAGFQVAVVKLARGNSWLGEWRRGAPPAYFAELERSHAAAAAAWGDAATHFVWLQSESDSQQQVRADEYETNLRGFVAEVRELWGPVDFWQCKLQPTLAPSSTGPVIREAQARVMAESELNHLLDFDDVRGALHYTSPQIETLGHRVAAAIAAQEATR